MLKLGLIDKIHADTPLKAWYHIALSRIFMKNKKYVLFVGLQTPRKTVKKTINSNITAKTVIDNLLLKHA